MKTAWAIISIWLVVASVFAADPPSPFGPRPAVRDDARWAEVRFSDGSTLTGHLTVTRNSPFTVYDRQRKTFRNVPLEAVASIAVAVEEERMEREWRFLEHANDEKVFTGREYPMRQYVMTVEATTGVEISGDCSKLMTLTDAAGQAHRLILHKRHKGEPGTTLEELVYITRITFPQEPQEGAHEPQRGAATPPAEQDAP